MEISHFILECASYLDIIRPYEVKFVPLLKDVRATYIPYYKDEIWKGPIVLHEITISLEVISSEDELRTLYELIAHEFVHAWQEENGYAKTKHHGPEFIEVCSEMRSQFWAVHRISLKNIYIFGTDV